MHLVYVAFRPCFPEARDLRGLDRGVQFVQGRRASVGRVGVSVYADDDALTGLDRALMFDGAALDLVLREAGLNRGQHATAPVYLGDQRAGARLDLRRERLDGVRSTDGIDDVRDAGLLRQDLLRTQRDARGGLGRQRQRLVEPVGVQ